MLTTDEFNDKGQTKDSSPNVSDEPNYKEYTPSSLCDYLNKMFGAKNSGNKFNAQDIQQYEIRGSLPKRYGGNVIKSYKHKTLGIKILKLYV